VQSWISQRADASPTGRLQHHLGMARLAADLLATAALCTRRTFIGALSAAMHDLWARPMRAIITRLKCSSPLLARDLASDSALPRFFTPRSTPRTKRSEVILQESFITRRR
jgi:hypothetical protein